MVSRSVWPLLLAAAACSPLRLYVPEPKACDPDQLNASMERLVLEVSAPDPETARAFVQELQGRDGPLVFVEDLGAPDLVLSLRPEIPECVRLADSSARVRILSDTRSRLEAEGLARACAAPVQGCAAGTPLAALTFQGSYRPAAFAHDPDPRHRFVVLEYACTETSAVRQWLEQRSTPRGLAWGTSRLPGKPPARTFFSCPDRTGELTQLGEAPLPRRDPPAEPPPPGRCWVRLQGVTRLSEVLSFMSELEDRGAKVAGSCSAQDGYFLCPLTCGGEMRGELESLEARIQQGTPGSRPIQSLGIDPSGRVLSLRRERGGNPGP